MSIATALGSVSRSLRTQLLNSMDIEPTVGVTLLAPDETAATGRRVNLFLYQLTEHTHLRNAGPHLRPGSATEVDGPPLSLVLSYLMTAYANNDPGTGNAEAHAVLGEAMRVFHEQPFVPTDALEDDLTDMAERLWISPVPLDPESVSRVWSTFSTPYRLSVAYEVSVVQLDQGPAGRTTLPARVRSVGVPGVQAPYVPPRLTGMQPVAGPAGSQITFTGEHLTGWRGTVIVSGNEVAAAVPLSGDQFTVTVPATLPPGFHEIRAGISNLSRATFFFEVV